MIYFVEFHTESTIAKQEFNTLAEAEAFFSTAKQSSMYVDEYKNYDVVLSCYNEENDEYVDLKQRVQYGINAKTDNLLDMVQDWAYNKYSRTRAGYVEGYVEAEDEDGWDEEIGSYQIRLSDHSQNPNNIDRFGNHDYYISVVICNKDKTNFIQDLRENEVQIHFNDSFTVAEIYRKIEELVSNAESFILETKTI